MSTTVELPRHAIHNITDSEKPTFTRQHALSAASNILAGLRVPFGSSIAAADLTTDEAFGCLARAQADINAAVSEFKAQRKARVIFRDNSQLELQLSETHRILDGIDFGSADR